MRNTVKKEHTQNFFLKKKNRISNDIIIPLQVPKEVGILTKKFSWTNLIKAKIQPQIPDFPVDIDLKDCKNHVSFSLNSNNTISLSLTSAKAQFAAVLSGTPTETNWPINDILVRGNFINQHIDKQPRVEETFEAVNVECHQSQRFQSST